MANRSFSVVLDPDPDGGFTVTVPALPSVVTQGETVEEALDNAREAIALTVEDLVERGEPVPRGDAVLATVHVAV